MSGMMWAIHCIQAESSQDSDDAQQHLLYGYPRTKLCKVSQGCIFTLQLGLFACAIYAQFCQRTISVMRDTPQTAIVAFGHILRQRKGQWEQYQWYTTCQDFRRLSDV